MLTVIEKIRMICADKNIKVSNLESSCGFSNGYLNPRRMRNLPSDRLQAVADYLNLSVDEILAYGERKKTAPINEGGLTDLQRALISAVPRLSDDTVLLLMQIISKIEASHSLPDD